MKVLLDTNIVIEHFRNGLLTNYYQRDFFVSVITEAELLRYSKITTHEQQWLERFLSITTIVPVDSAIARTAALLGRKRKTKLPDLLIAATALELNIPLFTKNTRDFCLIPGLEVQTII